VRAGVVQESACPPPASQPPATAAEARHREIAEALGADNLVVAGRFVEQHQRHAIHGERLTDARHQPLAKAIEIEIAVQIAGKSHEGAAVVVLVPIERPVKRIFESRFHGAEEQHTTIVASMAITMLWRSAESNTVPASRSSVA
jgi:hypothetical protein